MEKLELLKRVRGNVLERIIREFGDGIGNLKDMKLSIWDVRVVVYDEVNELAKEIFEGEFSK